MAVAKAAKQELEGIHTLHFPIIFPEVFLRDRPGFDVILGNPPWNKPKIEEHAFWARHFPGFRGLSQRERETEKARLCTERPDLIASYEAERDEMDRVRKVLISGAYPGIGTGDPDFYKAFCWRFWHLTVSKHGRIGVVLPRGALSAKGSTEFRQIMFDRSASVELTMLLNNGGWVFPVEHRYTIGLVCIAHGEPIEKSVRLRGPFSSYEEFNAGRGGGGGGGQCPNSTGRKCSPGTIPHRCLCYLAPIP